MPSRSGILCIDFGTSSVRAALSEDGRARPRVLELGEAVRSSIDRASIPSAVFVDADRSKITFGEEAFKKGQRGEKSLLFEMSPKRWMTADSPAMLDTEIVAGTGLTRKHLLAGLLAQAFSATTTAVHLSKTQLLQLETRVAHPVWSPNTQSTLRQHLRWITDVARQLSGTTDQAISPDKLSTAIAKASGNPRRMSLRTTLVVDVPKSSPITKSVALEGLVVICRSWPDLASVGKTVLCSSFGSSSGCGRNWPFFTRRGGSSCGSAAEDLFDGRSAGWVVAFGRAFRPLTSPFDLAGPGPGREGFPDSRTRRRSDPTGGVSWLQDAGRPRMSGFGSFSGGSRSTTEGEIRFVPDLRPAASNASLS